LEKSDKRTDERQTDALRLPLDAASVLTTLSDLFTSDVDASTVAGSSSEAQEFLSRHADLDGQVIVRMRGLPYTCTHQQVVGYSLFSLATPVNSSDF